MSTHREGIFVEGLWVEPKEAKSSSSKKVDEVGATSAPLLSASFHLQAYCAPFNEDFMLCKAENTDPKACLKEGRKVTRCSIDL
jgi:NADH dehydrogenase (ubiquinone) 1 alpha subcomplex subunit 8